MRVRKGFIYILLTAAAISLAPCHAAQAAEPDREELNLMQAANEMRASGRVQLNFKDVEIVKFLRFMSELAYRARSPSCRRRPSRSTRRAR